MASTSQSRSSCKPDTTEAGTPTAFIKLVRDISERVEIEDRLRQTGEELRLVEDRERIARDLHDKVIQRLFAAGMALQAVSGIVTMHDTNAARRMDAVVDELDETIREIRGAIYGLQPQTDRESGLRHQILRIVEDQRGGSRLRTPPPLRGRDRCSARRRCRTVARRVPRGPLQRWPTCQRDRRRRHSPSG